MQEDSPLQPPARDPRPARRRRRSPLRSLAAGFGLVVVFVAGAWLSTTLFGMKNSQPEAGSAAETASGGTEPERLAEAPNGTDPDGMAADPAIEPETAFAPAPTTADAPPAPEPPPPPAPAAMPEAPPVLAPPLEPEDVEGGIAEPGGPEFEDSAFATPEAGDPGLGDSGIEDPVTAEAAGEMGETDTGMPASAFLDAGPEGPASAPSPGGLPEVAGATTGNAPEAPADTDMAVALLPPAPAPVATPPAAPAPAPSSPAVRATAPVPGTPPARGPFTVQVGTFSVTDNADRLVERLARAGFDAYSVDWTDDSGRQWRAVRVGSIRSAEQARRMAADVRARSGEPASVMRLR